MTDDAPPTDAADPFLSVFDVRKHALEIALARSPTATAAKVVDDARAFLLFLDANDPVIDAAPSKPKRRKHKWSKERRQAQADRMRARSPATKKAAKR